jgi:hypothetical protein
MTFPKQWAVELAVPWCWRKGERGPVCEVVLCSVYWTDGPGLAVSFTRDSTWTPVRVWTQERA